MLKIVAALQTESAFTFLGSSPETYFKDRLFLPLAISDCFLLIEDDMGFWVFCLLLGGGKGG